jgi:hypothetical protein
MNVSGFRGIVGGQAILNPAEFDAALHAVTKLICFIL